MPQNIYIYNPGVLVPEDVLHVEIPEGVTAIRQNAFKECYALRSVTIPHSVTEIKNDAFFGCFSLPSIAIPDSITKIGQYAFAYCQTLQSVEIPDGVTEISDDVFHRCVRLQSIRIPDSVTEIGRGAFCGCSGLQSVVIPDSVTAIGNNAFKECSSLQSVTIPGNVTEIGNETFSECTQLQSVTMPDCIRKIGTAAFYNCSGLQSVTIPESVTEIEDNTFEKCFRLQSVTIPEGVTKIGHHAFDSCPGLRSVTIPDSVTEIGRGAFWGCSGLQSIAIPDSIRDIRLAAFKGCTGLQTVILPGRVMHIHSNAFFGCSNLRSVTLPDGITRIENNAFAECFRLQSLMFRDINIAPFINIDGYGVNTFDVIRTLAQYGIPINENTVKFGIDMEHRSEISQWVYEYPIFGTMHLPASVRVADKATEDRLRQCFAVQRRTKGRVPQILRRLAVTACVCGIPPERLAETFDVEYTQNRLNKKIPIVPAEACRCYYDRGVCNMLIQKGKVSVMAEAISLYNKSGHQAYYKFLTDFILSHPDTKTEDLQYAVAHAEEIPMRAETTLAQIRQHRTYTENLAEVTKIEAEYGKVVPDFRLSDYPCNLDLTGIIYNGMTARVLDLSDGKDVALAARLGSLTHCCQRLGRSGETAMMHGFLNPDAGFWVIEDKDGNIKAQAEIWEADGGILVFDNIEFANTDSEHMAERAEQLRGIIAAWAMKSGYENIIMGCGYNELGTETMEKAPIPKLILTPAEVFALQRNNGAHVFFDNVDAAEKYMRTPQYEPENFVYTDTDEECVYIKKNGTVSDYLMQGYICTLAEKRPASERKAEKERGDEIA